MPIICKCGRSFVTNGGFTLHISKANWNSSCFGGTADAELASSRRENSKSKSKNNDSSDRENSKSKSKNNDSSDSDLDYGMVDTNEDEDDVQKAAAENDREVQVAYDDGIASSMKSTTVNSNSRKNVTFYMEEERNKDSSTGGGVDVLMELSNTDNKEYEDEFNGFEEEEEEDDDPDDDIMDVLEDPDDDIMDVLEDYAKHVNECGDGDGNSNAHAANAHAANVCGDDHWDSDDDYDKKDGNTHTSTHNTNSDSDSASTGGDNNISNDANAPVTVSPGDASLLENFHEYQKKSKEFSKFSRDEEAAIELLKILRDRRVPISLYDIIYEWHLANLSATSKPAQNTLIQKLEERYNLVNSKPQLTLTTLPFSGARVDLVTQDAKWQIQSLLLHPQLTDDCYLFDNLDNPFQKPCSWKNWNEVGDINSGRCYRKTYEALITDPSSQILLPILFYMDGTVTGQFDALPIEALKFTLGIFNGTTRDKDWAWKTIGYVANYLPEKTKGEDIIADSAHIDALYYKSKIAEEKKKISTCTPCTAEEKDELRREVNLDAAVGELTNLDPDIGELVDLVGAVQGIRLKDETKDRHPGSKKRGRTAGYAVGISGNDETYLLNDSMDDSDDEDARMLAQEREEEEGGGLGGIDPDIPVVAAQDLHTMMEIFLAPYRKLQDAGGFPWELHLRGKVHKCHLIPFVMFIKGDTQEHDKHCGKFTSRTKKIKNLCRYCCCPNRFTDDPYRAGDPRKSPKMIERLMKAQSQKALNGISQQKIDNCWYSLRFGLHNSLGVHGACPLEVLHWLQLGKYKYIRLALFNNAGTDTQLGNALNECAKSMGILFRRQSDRDLPRTDFAKGVKKGKLMAHEMTGVLLVLLSVLRSTHGRAICKELAKGKAKKHLGNDEAIDKWICLVENCLGLEAWLAQERIPLKQLNRLRGKVREILKLEKEVGQRDKSAKPGMGYHTFNFHAALHIHSDILNMGVPKWVNTMSNEMHHKASKNAALTTQRRPQFFNLQSALRCHEMDCVNLASVEISKGRAPFSYGTDVEQEQEETTVSLKKVLSGVRIELQYNRCSESFLKPKVKSRMKNKSSFKLDAEVLALLRKTVKEDYDGDLSSFDLYTEHRRGEELEILFRGSPRFLGRPWRDWAMVDWGDGMESPVQIYCFVDLGASAVGLDPDKIYGTGAHAVKGGHRGVFMVVESADRMSPREDTCGSKSTFFIPYEKEFATTTSEDGEILVLCQPDGTPRRKLYMIPVDSITEPICMIPDVGHKKRGAYLYLKPRREWANEFGVWLMMDNSWADDDQNWKEDGYMTDSEDGPKPQEYMVNTPLLDEGFVEPEGDVVFETEAEDNNLETSGTNWNDIEELGDY